MKKILLLSLFSLSLGIASAQPKTDKKAKPTTHSNSYVFAEFRNIAWGSHIDSIFRNGEKLTFLKSNDVADKSAYILQNDDPMLGTVELSNVYYLFSTKGRFNGVLLRGDRDKDSRNQFGEMKYILTYKFGTPELREIAAGIQYFWLVDDVRVILTDQSAATFFTVEFSSDYERSESKKINMSVDDF